MTNQETEKKASPLGTLIRYVRKHAGSLFLYGVITVLLLSPQAKSWVLEQLLATGIFNADIKEGATAGRTPLDFEFEDENGNLRNTSQLRGKVVFINFWASWCPPCRAEFPSIETLYAEYKDNPDVFFLIINEDRDIVTAKQYLENEKSSIPIYRLRSKVPEAVYSGTLPTTVVLGKDGTSRFHHEGFANYAAENFIKQFNTLVKE